MLDHICLLKPLPATRHDTHWRIVAVWVEKVCDFMMWLIVSVGK